MSAPAPRPAAKAVIPFRFSTSFVLPEATGLRAATLPQLVGLLREVPESCVYHHTHYFLLSHHYLTPEPTNDFAYWVTQILGEIPLGERLASIDTMQYASLDALRDAFVRTIDDYLTQRPLARFKFASEGEEFFFVKSMQVVMPTRVMASTLEEFAVALSRVSVNSLYFHIFDARLRLGRPTSDFSVWIEQQLSDPELANEISGLDPYSLSLEQLRELLIRMIRDRAASLQVASARPAAGDAEKTIEVGSSREMV